MDSLRPPSEILAALPAFEKHLSVIKGSGAKTAKRYSGYVAAFDGFFTQRLKPEESVKLVAVQQTDIDDWLKHLYFTGNTANVTRATKLSALRQFWRFLIYSGLATSSPAANIPSPRIVRPMAQKFTVQHLIKIFASTAGNELRAIRDRAMMMVLYGSGPRVEEIAALDVDDFITREDGGYVLHYRKTKGGKSRYVGIKSIPANAIMAWLAIRPKYAFPAERALFTSMIVEGKGTRLSKVGFNRTLKKHATAVGGQGGIRVFVHKMRSTFATDLYDEGHGLKEISIVMGHSSVAITERYVSISEKVLKQTMISTRRWKNVLGGGADEK